MRSFEFFEHTADIGVRVYGETLEKLFENSAKALFTLITDYKDFPNLERKITLEAQNLEELLVNWLNELISLFFTYKFLPQEYNINIKGEDAYLLKALLKGVEYNPYTNKINMEIKAATYHNLKIENFEEGYRVEIIFDV